MPRRSLHELPQTTRFMELARAFLGQAAGCPYQAVTLHPVFPGTGGRGTM
jgi:hypothetical protein